MSGIDCTCWDHTHTHMHIYTHTRTHTTHTTHYTHHTHHTLHTYICSDADDKAQFDDNSTSVGRAMGYAG